MKEFKLKLSEFFKSKGLSEPSSAIVRGGFTLLEVLKEGNVLVPVVSNGNFFSGDVWLDGPLSFKIVEKSKIKLKDKVAESFCLVTKVEGKGLYARIEDFFKWG